MKRVLADINAIVTFLRIPLILLVAASLAVMFLANEDPLLRDTLCRAHICFHSEYARGWNKLFYDFAAGCVIAVVFYWLLARWPEYQKRKRIKRSFRAQYRTFKLACIQNFLAVVDGGYNGALPKTLLPIDNFRNYFNQKIGDGRDRWDEVENRMSPYYLDVTLLRMEILRQEISLVLYSIDVRNDDAFELLKRLSQAMHMQQNAAIDYDSMKSFLGFFWSLFAGWSSIEGYRDRDIVEDMIESF